jgi:cytochrome c biogenesis protein CcmG/thiol:disulfide interchange protein DsbE
VLSAGLVGVLATRPSATAVQAGSPLLGKTAPDFTDPVATGGAFSLAAQRGKWVVLNFFASWCAPCQQEEPNLVQFAYGYGQPKDAEVVGVEYNDTVSLAQEFLDQTGGKWPLIVDTGGRIAYNFGVLDQPETFLISPQGIVEAKFDGAITAAQLDAVITESDEAQ